MQQASSPIVFTNIAKCRDCNRCVRYCPVKAIKIEKGQAQVMTNNCIACGTCVLECPQHAKTYRHDVDKVLNLIQTGTPIAISVAPSFVAQYNEWEQRRLPSALRLLGFTYIGETAVGAYHVAMKSKSIAEENPNQSHIFTACPAIVNYIEKYKTEFASYLTPVVSPMIAHARLLHVKLPKNAKVVFVGPCIAKKQEAERKEFDGLIDAVITFEELNDLFKTKAIDLMRCEESLFDEEPGPKARLFPIEGGLLKTASMDTDHLSFTTLAISGFEELNDALEAINNSEQSFIIEPLFCHHGCVNGPAMTSKKSALESRSDILNFDKKNKGKTKVDKVANDQLSTLFHPLSVANPKKFNENEIREVLHKTGKNKVEDELNCGSCGYVSCREKAIAVLEGIAEQEMCIPFMKQLAETKNDILIETSPNGIVVLDNKLQIISMNPAFKKMFSCSDAILGKKISYLIDPDPFERIATGQEKEIRKSVRYQNYNLFCHQICYVLAEDEQYIGIFVDMTDTQNNKEKLNDIKTETIIQAQELIEHQVRMAQELARFLGDSTAQGEMLMNKLIDAIKK